jgi:hypothetical protein
MLGSSSTTNSNFCVFKWLRLWVAKQGCEAFTLGVSSAGSCPRLLAAPMTGHIGSAVVSTNHPERGDFARASIREKMTPGDEWKTGGQLLICHAD